MTGRRIVLSAWVVTGVFAIAVVLGVVWPASQRVAIGVSVAGFLLGSGVALYGFGVGIVRSARGDDVSVANLFLLQGSAPRIVRRHFGGIVLVSLVVVGVSFANLKIAPYSWLELMVPVGFPSLWAARHGVFPARPTPTA